MDQQSLWLYSLWFLTRPFFQVISFVVIQLQMRQKLKFQIALTLSTFADRRRSHLKHLSSNGNWLIPIDSADNIFQIHIENLNLRCHIVKLRSTYGRLVWVHTSCHQSMPAWLEWKKKTGAEAEIALFKQGLFHESCLAVYKRVWDCWSSHVSPLPPLHASVLGWYALLYNITLEDPRFYSLRQRDLLIEAKIICFALFSYDIRVWLQGPSWEIVMFVVQCVVHAIVLGKGAGKKIRHPSLIQCGRVVQ